MSLSIGQKVKYQGEEYTVISKTFSGLHRIAQVIQETGSSYLIAKEYSAIYADECEVL